jgi:type II secretory pathway component PulF
MDPHDQSCCKEFALDFSDRLTMTADFWTFHVFFSVFSATYIRSFNSKFNFYLKLSIFLLYLPYFTQHVSAYMTILRCAKIGFGGTGALYALS